MQVNDKIRLARISKGYSQEYMAISLGIDTTTYGRLERGQIKITIDRLQDISKVIGTPLVEIIEDSTENNRTLDLILNEIKIIRKINENLLETIKTKSYQNHN